MVYCYSVPCIPPVTTVRSDLQQHGSSFPGRATTRGPPIASTAARVHGKELWSALAGDRRILVRTVDELHLNAVLHQDIYAQEVWMGW